MSAQAYGGVRAGAMLGRFGSSGNLSAQLTTGNAPAGGTRGVAGPPAGSPYTATPTPQTVGPPTHKALLILVAAEVLALVALRGGFRKYHGG